MAHGCNSGLYVEDNVLPTLAIHIVPFLGSSLLVCIAAIFLGLVSRCFESVYKIWATTAAEAVVKLALIPDVQVRIRNEDETLEGSEGASTRRSRDAEENTSQLVEEGSILGIRERVLDRGENNSGSVPEVRTPVSRITSRIEGICDQTRRRHTETIKWKYKEAVCFDIGGELFPVRHTFPVMVFPAAVLLLAAYVSLFVTGQWHHSKNCGSTDAVTGTQKVCYYLHECSDRINCTAWKAAKRNEELVCTSLSIDIFKPLIQLVSLLAVQVAIMNFGVAVFNRGWPCTGDSTWKRYSCICVLQFLFVLSLLAIGVYHLVRELRQGILADAFMDYLIPIGNMVFVALAEAVFLFVFTMMLFLGPKFSEKIDGSKNETPNRSSGRNAERDRVS
jgi:hypothetical protein